MERNLESENKRLLEELKALKEERRRSLIESYQALCKEKGIKEQDTKDLSDETIKVLIEQVKAIELPKQEEKSELKSVVSTEIPQEMERFVIERGSRGLAVFEMPDVEKWRKLHADLPFRR